MKIKIRSTVAAAGLPRGAEVYVEASAFTDAMLDKGMWVWLDQPEPLEATVVLTPEVKKRAPKLKAADLVPDPVVDEIADQALTELIQLSEDLGLYAYEEVDNGAGREPEAETP